MPFFIKCRTCKGVYEIKRDVTAPATAIGMGCNWCPNCQNRADAYYHEWYYYAPRPKKPEVKEQTLKLNI